VFGFRDAVRRFMSESGMFLAAGLAFFFIVCVIPLVLLGVSTVGFVLSTEEAAQEVVGQAARNFPVYRREIATVLLRIVHTRALSGLLGTLVLIFFSTPLFGASRFVLHRMMGVTVKGQYLRNLLLDAGMVLLLTVMLFAVSSVTWLFQWFQDFILAPALLPVKWMYATTVAFSIGISTIMFYVGYRYVPRVRSRAGPALAGALLAALLWEIAKQLFRIYIRKVGLYDQIYGPFGVLIAFVMFVYYSAIVFTFGAAYVAALDSRSTRR
jgi:membrane protein